MRNNIQRAALAFLLSAAGFAETPELISGLAAMNAASLAGEGLPNAGVAPGARFALFGRDLDAAPATARVTMSGASAEVTVLAVTRKRIDLLLPMSTPLGSGTVTLEFNGAALYAPIRVVERAFGVTSDNVPGAIRGTGLGRDGSPAGIEVVVAGQSVPPVSVSRGADGWDDIAFEVPAGAASCATPVAVRSNGRLSNSAFIATTSGCAAPEPGAQRSVGAITLSRSSFASDAFRNTSESGSGAFLRGPAFDGAGVPASGYFRAGSCTLVYAIEQDFADFAIQELDAGDRLELNGPKGSRDLVRLSKGIYGRELGRQLEAPSVPGLPQLPGGGLFLDPGDYTVNGFGGADVGAFSARVSVPAPATWTNQTATANIDRAKDFTVEWRGATDAQLVTVVGSAATNSRPSVGASFTCVERGGKGSLTIPAEILSALPATREGGLMSLSVAAERGAEFEATGLDGPGTIGFAQSIAGQAQFR